MELEGRVWKEGKFWMGEVPSLDLMTQGKSKKDALNMVLDAAMELLYDAFPEKISKSFGLHLYPYEGELFGLEATDTGLLLSLSLKRQREKNGLTLREVASRLGSQSPNAYARYERGSVVPSFKKLDQLIHAVNPNRRGILVR